MTEVSLLEYLERIVGRLHALDAQTPAPQPVSAETLAAYHKVIAHVADVGIDVGEFAIDESAPVAYDVFKTRLDWALDFIGLLVARRPKNLAVTLPDDE